MSWFKSTAPTDKCCLLMFIDDTTWTTGEETESTFDYMAATRDKPSAFYSGRHAFFHVGKRDAHTERLTHFGRVLKDLNIERICTNSSQQRPH
ncbi:hypothetical protein IFO68_17400 [Photobacterium sp. CAU 1568]|uniref:Uncharacterized protein n=2 Tax=Vibrionaceae TaxID=641 RepID=A0ABR9BS48_9GAMM|nr:hypothetical protein [Photobacterium arenosum]